MTVDLLAFQAMIQQEIRDSPLSINVRQLQGKVTTDHPKQDLSDNTATDLTITGAYRGPVSGGAEIRTRGDTNNISIEWDGNNLIFWVDLTKVLVINCAPFPRSI